MKNNCADRKAHTKNTVPRTQVCGFHGSCMLTQSQSRSPSILVATYILCLFTSAATLSLPLFRLTSLRGCADSASIGLALFVKPMPQVPIRKNHVDARNPARRSTTRGFHAVHSATTTGLKLERRIT
jgi:hypothetical protein